MWYKVHCQSLLRRVDNDFSGLQYTPSPSKIYVIALCLIERCSTPREKYLNQSLQQGRKRLFSLISLSSVCCNIVLSAGYSRLFLVIHLQGCPARLQVARQVPSQCRVSCTFKTPFVDLEKESVHNSHYKRHFFVLTQLSINFSSVRQIRDVSRLSIHLYICLLFYTLLNIFST